MIKFTGFILVLKVVFIWNILGVRILRDVILVKLREREYTIRVRRCLGQLTDTETPSTPLLLISMVEHIRVLLLLHLEFLFNLMPQLTVNRLFSSQLLRITEHDVLVALVVSLCHFFDLKKKDLNCV